MKNIVKIIMKSVQIQGKEDPVTTEFITYGTLSRYGSKYRISYEESDMFGQSGVTSTFITENGRVSLERSGKINALMEFRAGETTETMYDTEYGTMLMQIKARKVTENINEKGGTIQLEYELNLSHVFVAINQFFVQVELPDKITKE